jgi:ribonuclease HII
VAYAYRIGADENGLGARLGPLVVTAVLARVEGDGERLFTKRLPKRIQRDLGDSKKLVSHHDFGLGEAWARALCGQRSDSPADLFHRISLEGSAGLREPCPSHIVDQCWGCGSEVFVASDELVERVRAHYADLARRGVQVLRVRTSIVCTQRLNTAKERGHNRFVSDLHAMERLVLELRREAGEDVMAVCGKVGGMGDYSRFFGPLSGWLHAVLAQGRKKSGYRFPGLGELYFVQDADARDPLVMLASLVGKWVRELLMARVARYYLAGEGDVESPSGYHDPVTARFVDATSLLRQRRRVPAACFERARDVDA